MNDPEVVKNWHIRILEESQARLGRELTPKEEHFVTSRGGFVALEAIEDTVNSIGGAELEAYLNSEND